MGGACVSSWRLWSSLYYCFASCLYQLSFCVPFFSYRERERENFIWPENIERRRSANRVHWWRLLISCRVDAMMLQGLSCAVGWSHVLVSAVLNASSTRASWVDKLGLTTAVSHCCESLMKLCGCVRGHSHSTSTWTHRSALTTKLFTFVAV